jgi:hypothetical protein
LIVFLATTTPLLAAEYWVSQNPETKECKVTEKMPNGKNRVMVGATSYPTAKEAWAAASTAISSGACVKKAK